FGYSIATAANGPSTIEWTTPPVRRSRAMNPNRSAFDSDSPRGLSAQMYMSHSQTRERRELQRQIRRLVHRPTFDFNPRMRVERPRLHAQTQLRGHTPPAQQHEQRQRLLQAQRTSRIERTRYRHPPRRLLHQRSIPVALTQRRDSAQQRKR